MDDEQTKLDTTTRFPENQTLQYRNSSAAHNATLHSTNTSEIVRPFALNMFTVTFHLLAFLFILFPKSVKPSLRIFLFSLSLPGFLQNLTWGAVRACQLWLRGPFVDGEPGCVALLFVTQLGMHCGQTTVTALTVNNFVAVTHPILFKRWMTTGKTLVCVISIWIFWGVVAIVDLFSRPGTDKPCLPMVVTPIYMLVTQALVILLTSLTVTVLNTRLVVTFLGKFKVYPMGEGEGRSGVVEEGRSEYPSMYVGGQSTIFTVAEEAEPVIDNPRNNRESALPGRFSRLSNSFRNKNQISRHELLVPTPCYGPARNGVESTVSVPSSAPLPMRASASAQMRITRRMRMRNMAITLIVLSIWNSVGYLPFMCCLLLAVHNRGHGPSKVLLSLSDVAGQMIRISLIGNTFLYAWRFIKWHPVCQTLRRRLSVCP